MFCKYTLSGLLGFGKYSKSLVKFWAPVLTDLNLSNSAKEHGKISYLTKKILVMSVLDGKDINSHVNKAMNSARATVTRIKSDIGNFSPRVILEIGN